MYKLVLRDIMNVALVFDRAPQHSLCHPLFKFFFLSLSRDTHCVAQPLYIYIYIFSLTRHSVCRPTFFFFINIPKVKMKKKRKIKIKKKKGGDN